MKLTIEPTSTIALIDGVECRLWRGTTESDLPCAVFVHRIALPDCVQPQAGDFVQPRPNPQTVNTFEQVSSAPGSWPSVH